METSRLKQLGSHNLDEPGEIAAVDISPLKYIWQAQSALSVFENLFEQYLGELGIIMDRRTLLCKCDAFSDRLLNLT